MPTHCFSCSPDPKPLDAANRCRCGNRYTEVPDGKPPAMVTTYGSVDKFGKQRMMVQWVEANGRIRGQVFRTRPESIEPWLLTFDLKRVHKAAYP